MGRERRTSTPPTLTQPAAGCASAVDLVEGYKEMGVVSERPNILALLVLLSFDD